MPHGRHLAAARVALAVLVLLPTATMATHQPISTSPPSNEHPPPPAAPAASGNDDSYTCSDDNLPLWALVWICVTGGLLALAFCALFCMVCHLLTLKKRIHKLECDCCAPPYKGDAGRECEPRPQLPDPSPPEPAYRVPPVTPAGYGAGATPSWPPPPPSSYTPGTPAQDYLRCGYGGPGTYDHGAPLPPPRSQQYM